ncbi:MAG: hypothetical protein OEZ06_07975 [Myxococcales bacterium]|nr:hypothetical protein [Myxococcales bacterium]
MQEEKATRSDATELRGRSAALTIALVIAALLVIAVGLRLAGHDEAFSHRVVVAAQGCGRRCDGPLARRLARELSKVGLDAVAPRAERGFDGPEAVRDFAREHGARFAVMLVMAVEQRAALEAESERALEATAAARPATAPAVGTIEGAARVGANAALYVMDVKEETAPKPSYVLRSIEDGDSERAALGILARRFADALFPVTASTLLTSEPVASLIAAAGSMEEQAAALAIKRRAADIEARREAIEDYKLRCEANDGALSVSNQERCISEGCSEEYLVGVLPDGSAAVVHDSSDHAIFPLDRNSSAQRFLGSERLWLVPFEGERRLLTEAPNFYSRPDLSTDGRWLGYLERRRGRTRLFVQPLQGGPRQQLASAESPMGLHLPRLNADGRRILYFEREDGRQAQRLVLRGSGADAGDVTTLDQVLDADFVELSLSEGEAPRRLVAALLWPEEREGFRVEAVTVAPEAQAAPAMPSMPRLALLDAITLEPAVELPQPTHRLRSVGVVHRGTLVMPFDDTRCGVAVLRPNAPEGEVFEWLLTERCPRRVASGAEGLVVEAPAQGDSGKRRIYALELETGKMTALSGPAQDARQVTPAGEGKRFAFERVLPRNYGELQHSAVCFGQNP